MCTSTSEFARMHNLILFTNRLACQEAFENLSNTSRISCLGTQCCSRCVWLCHAMSRHVAPGMIGRWGLWKPNVTSVPCQFAIFQGLDDHIAFAQFPASCIHQICATLKQLDRIFINHVLRFGIQRTCSVSGYKGQFRSQYPYVSPSLSTRLNTSN